MGNETKTLSQYHHLVIGQHHHYQLPKMSLVQNEEFLKAAFRGYDKNGDGRVTMAEFKRVMLRTSPGMSDQKLDEMIAKADVDNNGTVNYKEFAKMMSS